MAPASVLRSCLCNLSLVLGGVALALYGQDHFKHVTIDSGASAGVGANISESLLLATCLIVCYANKRAQNKRELGKTEELFSIIIDGLNDGIFDYNIVADRIFYSPSYLKIWGRTEEELGKRHEESSQFIHPDDLVASRENIRKYLAREISSYCNIFRVLHSDGRWVWIMSRSIGMWDKNGKITRLIGVHTDITLQKQREEELLQLIRENERQKEELAISKEKADAANNAKSEFLATMSHEIRTPLNAIAVLSRLFMSEHLSQKQTQMVKILSANSDILLQLVTDLLDLNHIEKAQINLEERPFMLADLFATLHKLFDEQAATKKLKFSIVDRSGDQPFLGDAVRLQQILINLTNNALKFTERGGIWITADCEMRNDGKTNVIIAVADTGDGIAPEILPIIFDRFVQADQSIARRYGGSGLGLTICKSLAERMGGTVTVVSTPKEGSTFTLSLPFERNAAVAPLANNSIAVSNSGLIPEGGSNGTILIVEDFPANAMVMTMALEQLGYDVDVATLGNEAIRKVQASVTPYEAILMDVQMPYMDGFETTRRIRAVEKEKGIRHFIIGTTAHAFASDIERCLQSGMDDYLSKPFKMDLLAQKLEQFKPKMQQAQFARLS